MMSVLFGCRCGSYLKDNVNWLRHVQKRYKIRKKDHWALQRRKTFPKHIALANFDQFYAPVFGSIWPSVRLGLLCQEKYCAILNNYSDWETTEQELTEAGCLDMKKIFEKEQRNILKNRQARKRELDLNKIKRAEQEEEQTNLQSEVLASDRILSGKEPTEAAILGSFIPATELKGMEDWVEEDDYLKHFPADEDLPVDIQRDSLWNFPHHLKVKIYSRGDISTFPASRFDTLNVMNTYLLSASSLLPVLALDLQPSDTVLDMCAAPGGKSLAMLQTMQIGFLVCNDMSYTRAKRLRSVLNSYIPDNVLIRQQIKVTSENAMASTKHSAYDKVLLDVPCTNDRISLKENDNNWFSFQRIRERTQLPELQTSLLFSALCSVKPGGTVVYSTCSLSPVQNDGVVHMTLKRIWQETDMTLKIIDMSRAVMPFSSVFRFMKTRMRYGQLVLPMLLNNYGPLYFCKIRRES